MGDDDAARVVAQLFEKLIDLKGSGEESFEDDAKSIAATPQLGVGEDILVGAALANGDRGKPRGAGGALKMSMGHQGGAMAPLSKGGAKRDEGIDVAGGTKGGQDIVGR